MTNLAHVRMLDGRTVSGVMSANATLAIPAGFAIQGIYIKNLTENKITGGLRIDQAGIASGNRLIADEIGVGPNAEFYITGSPPIKRRFFSRTSGQAIAFRANEDWNGAEVEIVVLMDKLF